MSKNEEWVFYIKPNKILYGNNFSRFWNNWECLMLCMRPLDPLPWENEKGEEWE